MKRDDHPPPRWLRSIEVWFKLTTVTLVFFFFMRRTREAIWTVERVSEKSLGEAEMWAIMVVRQFMLPSDSLSNMVSLLSLVIHTYSEMWARRAHSHSNMWQNWSICRHTPTHIWQRSINSSSLGHWTFPTSCREKLAVIRMKLNDSEGGGCYWLCLWIYAAKTDEGYQSRLKLRMCLKKHSGYYAV